MKNNTWICSLCTDEDDMPKEFKNDEEYMAHNKVFHSADSPKLEKPLQPASPRGEPQAVEDVLAHLPETKVTKAVTLAYVYVGDCLTCGKTLDTLELDVGDKIKEHYVIAWCQGCHKQIVQRKVTKL